MIYIKDMDMPVDCLGCRISCKHESHLAPGRPDGCPLAEATGDLIRRTDAIEAVMAEGRKVYTSEYANAERIIHEADAVEALSMLPSAEGGDAKTNPIPTGTGVMIQSPSNGADLSAEATCATCADRAVCIMSAPDGNWKACKDYRPSAEAETHDIRTETHGRVLDGRADTIKELGEWLEQMIQHGVPSHSAKRKALATAIALLSTDAVQGEWVDVDNYYRLATCSRCHKVTMFEKWGEYTKPYDYCPNCGARMKGGVE